MTRRPLVGRDVHGRTATRGLVPTPSVGRAGLGTTLALAPRAFRSAHEDDRSDGGKNDLPGRYTEEGRVAEAERKRCRHDDADDCLLHDNIQSAAGPTGTVGFADA